MITDGKLLFSNAQAVTTTAISSNVYDTGPLDAVTTNYLDVGAGEPIYGFILIDGPFDTVGEAGTLTITFESDDVAALSSSTVHWTSEVIAEATLVAGYKIPIHIPQGVYQQALTHSYIGFRYTVGSGPFVVAGGNTCTLTTVLVAAVDKMQKAGNGMKFA